VKLECHVCKAHPSDGTTTYRVSEAGVLPAVWACNAHADVPIDPVVEQVVSDLEEGLHDAEH